MDGYYDIVSFGKRLPPGILFLVGFLCLVLAIQPGAAALTPSFYGMNQADRLLVNDISLGLSENMAYGDYLFLFDTTTADAGDSIDSWLWEITTPDPLAYSGPWTSTKKNATFGPFMNETPVIVNLTVTNSTSVVFNATEVYQVIDGRDWIDPWYYIEADYQNKSVAYPKGTITFYDNSFPLMYPMANVTHWWWNITDDSGGSHSESGTPFVVMSLDETDYYTVNLTVRNSQGNLASYYGFTGIPENDDGMIPNFAIVPIAGVAPLNVSFIDLSAGNVTGWEWNFDVLNEDPTTPNTSYDQHPFHTYGKPGQYIVGLTISDNFTSVSTTGAEVSVYDPPAPTVNFALAPVSGVKPLNVTAIAQVSGMNQSPVYRWNFGDGTVVDTVIPSWVHEYNETGTDPSLIWEYEVGLVVISDGTSYEVPYTRNVTMENPSPPRARFTAYPRIGPAPLEVAFIDQSEGREPFQNEWYFDDNTPVVFEQNPSHVFNETGVYNVTMRLHAANGFDQAYMNITVTEAVPERVDFTVAPTKGSNPLNVTVISQTTGLNESPVYHWDFGNGTALNTTIPSHVYQYNPYNPDPNMNWTYTISHVVYSDGIGYPAPYTWNVTVDNAPAPKALFNAYPREGSAPLEVAFFDQSVGQEPISYEWYFGDNSPKVFDDPNPVHVYTEPGEYDVTLMIHAANGEDIINQTGLIRVGAYPVPNVSFSMAPLVGYAPLKVSFMDLTCENDCSFTYLWQFGDGDSSSMKNPVHEYTVPGLYSVNLTVTNAWGISAKAEGSDQIEVKDTAETELLASFDYQQNGENPMLFQFVDTSMGTPKSWKWSFGDGFGTSIQSPDHLYLKAGMYLVNLTVGNSTSSDTASQFISISDSLF